MFLLCENPISSSGYFINGEESPVLMFVSGKTYKFDQSDSTNSSHPIGFYYDIDKNNQYTTNVTTSGTAGSSGAYVEIEITDSTPSKLFYQCQSHEKMGNYLNVSTSNIIKKSAIGTNTTYFNFLNLQHSSLDGNSCCFLQSS